MTPHHFSPFGRLNAPAAPARASRPLAALRCIGLCGAILLACVGAPRAQQTTIDPPGRVARLSEAVGTVWLLHPDNGDWVQADRNLPLTTGDRLATEPGARAELQIGSTTLRLDAGSDMTVAALDDARISLQLQAGALALRVRDAGEAGPLEVLTPEGRFSVLGAGAYRVDRGGRSSFVSVDAGQVRFDHAASALNVDAGQRGEFWLDAGGAAQYALLSPLNDAFTAWNRERDRGVDIAATARFVSPEVTGAADLARYGNWEQTPDYGAVWFPAAVAVDWAPYSTGRWAWVRPWGWTWVDDAPWGFAPFHYGRWLRVRDRWCWTPGVRAPRPVYAPALVGWVGGRPDGSAGFPRGVGPTVGWVPLAPGEVYVPSYRTTPRYAHDVNISITSFTRIDNIGRPRADLPAPRDFENRRFEHAVTIVPAAVMSEHRPVGPAAAPFRDAPWARDFAQRGVGSVALTAPPVAAPLSSGREFDPRAVRPPPGIAAGREGFTTDRAAEGGRSGFPAERAGDPGRVGFSVERGSVTARPGYPVEPRVTPSPLQSPGPAGPGQFAPSPAAGDLRGGRVRTPVEPFNGGPRPGNVAEPGATGVPSLTPRAAPTAEPLESPRMRALPVRRFDERRGDDPSRPDASTPTGRPQGPAPTVAPSPPVAMPAPSPSPSPLVRPIEPLRSPDRPVVSRPVEPPQAARPETVMPRPTEAQSPRRDAPRATEGPAARPAEAPRPAPAPAAEPRVAAPERRGESPQNR